MLVEYLDLLFLDDIFTDVAVVFGGGDHDDVVAGAAADGHLEGVERQGRHAVLLACLCLRDGDLRHTFRPGESELEDAVDEDAFGLIAHLELPIGSCVLFIFQWYSIFYASRGPDDCRLGIEAEDCREEESDGKE